MVALICGDQHAKIYYQLLLTTYAYKLRHALQEPKVMANVHANHGKAKSRNAPLQSIY